MVYSFHKSERLTRKILFEELFQSGHSFIKYPFRVVVKKSSQCGEFPLRIAVSVNKKRFKQAVRRNRIKRLTKEAVRLHKNAVYSQLPENTTYDLIFIYLDDQMPTYKKVEKSIRHTFDHLASLCKDNSLNIPCL